MEPNLKQTRLNNTRGLLSTGLGLSGPATFYEELQKVRVSSWTPTREKHVADAWKARNSQRKMGKPDLSDSPSANYNEIVASFKESQPIEPVRVPTYTPSQVTHTSLHPLQEWEGYITEIFNASFRARLIDITGNIPIEKEEARFLLFRVSKDDLRYVELGGIFRYIVGYKRSSAGKKVKTSRLFFRKRPNHSKFDLDLAKKEAKEIVEGIDWE